MVDGKGLVPRRTYSGLTNVTENKTHKNAKCGGCDNKNPGWEYFYRKRGQNLLTVVKNT